jgi:hypothetical protein
MIKKRNIQDYAKKYGIEAIIDHKEAYNRLVAE